MIIIWTINITISCNKDRKRSRVIRFKTSDLDIFHVPRKIVPLKNSKWILDSVGIYSIRHSIIGFIAISLDTEFKCYDDFEYFYGYKKSRQLF